MSFNIWTQCAGDSKFRLLHLEALRAVEAQHQVATRKLVDSDDEQALLEDLIESAKPPNDVGGHLHYLLAAPFRYPPLPHGSRFGTRKYRGMWYGAETHRAVFAETAYYRLLFIDGTNADLGTLQISLTVYHTTIRTTRGIDLITGPFDSYRRKISSKTQYKASQALGADMRTAGVEAFRYRSARDRRGGTNIGVFDPVVFGRRKPRGFETWASTATASYVELRKRDYFRRIVYTFPRSDFLVNGKLPTAAP